MKHHRPVRPGVTQTPFPELDYPPTPDDLRAYLIHAGVLLYGPTSWQSPLARDLHITPRMLRYYVSGEHTPPLKLLTILSRLLFQHAERCLDASQELSIAWDQATSKPVHAGPSKVLVLKPPRHPGDLAPITRRRKYGRDRA